MNTRNPTDDFFRKRLEHYEQEAPMNLWNEIDHRRHWQHRLAMRTQRNQPLLLFVTFLLSSALLGTLLWPDRPPELSCFPIPASEASPVAARQTPPPASALPGRFPSSGLLSVQSSYASAPGKAALPTVKLPPPAGKTSAPKTVGTLVSMVTAAFPELRVRKTRSGTLQSLSAVAPVLPERDPQCVRFGEPHRWRFYVDLSAGPALPSREIESQSPEFDAYAQARNETESPRLSYSAQARLSVVTDFGLALRTGMLYTQYNEKFDFTDNSEEKITITNIYGSNGEIIGTDTIVEKGMLRQIALNRYSLLDLPILLGYELHHKNWTVAFHGGPVINMLFSARGEFLSPEDMSPTAFSSDANGTFPAFRPEIGIGWYAGLGLHYQLQKDLELLVEPHFRLNPQSVTRDEYVLEQRYLSSGLSIGLRKQI